jgi:hypothetical protein
VAPNKKQCIGHHENAVNMREGLGSFGPSLSN